MSVHMAHTTQHHHKPAHALSRTLGQGTRAQLTQPVQREHPSTDSMTTDPALPIGIFTI